jgi:hypothetical protein
VSYLKFHDKDGDPLYVKNDILAIFTHAETDTIGSMLGPVMTVRKEPVVRVILSQSTGRWEVIDSYEDILDQIEAVPCA